MSNDDRDARGLVLESAQGDLRIGFPDLHIQDPSMLLHYVERMEQEVAQEIAKQPKAHQKIVFRINKALLQLSQSREILRLFLANLVITRFLFPAVLLRFGLTKVLGIYSLIPFNILVPTAYRMIKSVHGRYAIQRALGLRTLSELDLLLVELVGYDIDLRVLTILFHEAPEEHLAGQEILVIKRSVFRRPPDLPYVAIGDLERILGQHPHLGVRLAYFKERHKGLVHPRTYVILLLRSIAGNPDATRALVQLVGARGPAESAIRAGDRANVSRIWGAFAELATHKTWLRRIAKA